MSWGKARLEKMIFVICEAWDQRVNETEAFFPYTDGGEARVVGLGAGAQKKR